MFTHTTSLPQILPTQAYSEASFFEAEKATIFRHSWSFAGLKRDIHRDGSFLTTENGECPVIVWNIGGEFRAFRNVCLHRHSRICKESGNSQFLKCQYHGWEYSPLGQISKIPDASSFKGIELSSRHLEKLPVETLGDLIFIATDPNIFSLRTSLGELAEELDHFFGNHWISGRDQFTVDVNWKVAVENAVESYHVPMVHPQTFKAFRPPELHDHVLNEHFTYYRDLLPWETDATGRMLKRITKTLLPNPSYQRFTHLHIFPNLMFYFGDLFSSFNFLAPLEPERMRFSGVSFMPNQTRFGSAMRPAQHCFRLLFQPAWDRIMREDARILPQIQAGLKASKSKGVLSMREERVYAFQRFVEAMTGTQRSTDN